MVVCEISFYFQTLQTAESSFYKTMAFSQAAKQTQAAQFECVLFSRAIIHTQMVPHCCFKPSFEMIYNSPSSTVETLFLSWSSCIINSPAQAALIVVVITPVQLTSCLPLLVFHYDTKVYFAQTFSNV